MKKTMKRAVAATAVAAGIAGGTLAAAGEAQAAGPGDLAMLGGVSCEFKRWGPNWDSGPLWQMTRWMGVKNVGGSTMTNVNVTEIGGATKQVRIAGQPAGLLKPGQFYRYVETKWAGCWPSSISGYTIGAQVENLANNFGFWANVRQIPAPQNAPGPQNLLPAIQQG
ncbi:hypothetical protein EF294_20150 [Gordonia oryzae]|uniref:Secreted protein n=1 Tax=Gordonia oryzae TaxID=2487349 RepID=A0A3N4G1R8_9ACTN|nr:hypothetical protein [Gordonia oryzae]RPA56899.1 hypothetical protein EF294_20150 [Gordonia oryzae]